MAKMMNQHDMLAKNVMGVGSMSVNAVGVGCVNRIKALFEAFQNEEVNFLNNQWEVIVQTTKGWVVTKVRT